jgi:hypothetical protein
VAWLVTELHNKYGRTFYVYRDNQVTGCNYCWSKVIKGCLFLKTSDLSPQMCRDCALIQPGFYVSDLVPLDQLAELWCGTEFGHQYGFIPSLCAAIHLTAGVSNPNG